MLLVGPLLLLMASFCVPIAGLLHARFTTRQSQTHCRSAQRIARPGRAR
jgi:hypothetical protein